MRRFQDRFERQAEVFGCLFKHLTFSTHRGDQMPNGHISAPNPKLVSPVLRAGLKIFVGIAMLTHSWNHLNQYNPIWLM